jgi:hypothetical protein
MSMFPSAGDQIIHNEDGEVLGWDKPETAADYYCDMCGFSHAGECPDDYDEGDFDGAEEEELLPPK